MLTHLLCSCYVRVHRLNRKYWSFGVRTHLYCFSSRCVLDPYFLTLTFKEQWFIQLLSASLLFKTPNNAVEIAINTLIIIAKILFFSVFIIIQFQGYKNVISLLMARMSIAFRWYYTILSSFLDLLLVNKVQPVVVRLHHKISTTTSVLHHKSCVSKCISSCN